MRRTDLTTPVSLTAMERWPWAIRGLLGCVAAAIAVALTYAIKPLHAVPFLLAFPAVVLCVWFLGMWGGVSCALTASALVINLISRGHFRLSPGITGSDVRLPSFLVVSTLLGWVVRQLAQQRSLLATQELQQRLTAADAERQLAEERARASEAFRDRDDVQQMALRVNGMGLWVWDLQKDRIHWSDEIYLIAGLEPGFIEPTLQRWLQMVHPDDVASVRQSTLQSREDGSDYHQNYRLVWPDGSVHWVESKGKCQRDSDGQVVRVVGVLADVTSRRHSEEAMLRAEKLAVAGRLAASVAHEINNPLEAVTNLLYLITHAETTDVARTQAQQALEELMRVSLITQQTLKFHRQAGAPKLAKLSEILQAVLALFRGRLRSSQIIVDLHAEQEVSIACLYGEVQQIFANLVSNAIDAMPRGGRLLIRLRPSVDWRDWQTDGMRITLCDSGTGMNRATMQRIFEPFFTTKADTGTGLGMWVVAQLVERHHGQVRVWSRQRAGSGVTAISVFLPMGDALTSDIQAGLD